MNVEKIVPFKENKQRSGAKHLTLRDALAVMKGVQLAGDEALAEALVSPQEAIELLLADQKSDFIPAILFCGDIHLHENGSEYVTALYLKNRSTLITEKYWLDDPLSPSFTLAIAE